MQNNNRVRQVVLELKPMGKKIALLVYVSLMTRVIVEESTEEEVILNLARPKLAEKIETELSTHLDEIIQDTECPYSEEHDGN